MSSFGRSLTVAAALILVVAGARQISAQGNPDPASFKFNTGQNIQPIFEGWSHNADGSFAMWFGYYNRNYVEVPVIPVGPENNLSPGLADRDQPTVFGTRIHRKAFSVNVPADWGKKELTWTLTVHGKTEKAIAWLQREWEIDPIFAGKFRTPEMLKNTPPTITLDVPSTVTLPATLQLAATVVDDGLPKPRPPQTGPGPNDPPTLKPLPGQPEVPVNVPSVVVGRAGGGGGGGGGRGAQGPLLNVNWIVWRGPADVKFSQPTIPVKDQKAVATATFTRPGTYILRATANDSELTVKKEVTITVSGSPQQ